MKIMYEHFKGIKTHLEDVREAMTSSQVSVEVSLDDCGMSS